MTEADPPSPRVLRGRCASTLRSAGVAWAWSIAAWFSPSSSVAEKLTRAAPGAAPAAAGRFLREGKSAAKIWHEHVAEVVDVGEQEGSDLYLCDGTAMKGSR